MATMRIDCMFFCLAAFLSFRRSRALCTMTILQQGCDCVLSDIGRQIELSGPAFRCAKHSSENGPTTEVIPLGRSHIWGSFRFRAELGWRGGNGGRGLPHPLCS